LTGRIIFAVMLTLLLGYLTVQASGFLHDMQSARIALTVEGESYAARSRLVRKIDAMLQTLRDVHDHWETYAARPRDEWGPYNSDDLDLITGLETLLWVDESSGRQFLRTARQPALDVTPDPQQRIAIQTLRSEVQDVLGEVMLGPYATRDGYRIRVVMKRAPANGLLIAELHAPSMFRELLRDESPGYAVTVRWRDTTLFERDEAAVGIPGDWTREGMIRTSMGGLLQVSHTPTAELAASLMTPVLGAVLPLGFAITGLLALLIFENGRVNVRARAARQAELQVAELNKGLERLVAERTEALESRNADLVTITESVIHDLRNPLNAIAVNIALIEQRTGGAQDEETRDALRRSTSGVRRMAEILERVVGLALTAHSTFQRETLSMTELVAKKFAQLQSLEPPPPALLELGVLPEVEADDTLVRILLLNLLGNALRYTRGKDPRRISVSSEGHPSTGVTFCIRDNGCGLDAEDAKRIFAPFEKSGSNRRTDGMGLGLAIAERVVNRHGGKIWAEGVLGEGLAIYFTLAPAPGDPQQPA
jgi:signal transduction histidine kinase